MAIAKPQTDGAIELPPLNIKRLRVTLVGDTPLITHAWSQKAKSEMLAKQMKKATVGRAAKDPEREFEDACYRLPGGGFGVPVIAFKAAAVTACTSIAAMTKVAARQAFHVFGDQTGYDGKTKASGEMARIHGSEPTRREDMVRVGMGVADIRFRPEFWPWWVHLDIRVNANVLSDEQLLTLLNTAGFGVGVFEWRPERDGRNGMFHVATDADMPAIEEWERKTYNKEAA